MKTIVFYSYKGGTGRSLSLANIAICLSRLGKNVALIDLDFDAPGLHFKFGEKGLAATENGGVLEYIFKHVEKAKEKASDKTRPALAADIDNEPINKWVSEIQTEGVNDIGKIYLICAGKVYDKEYWNHLRKSEWYQMFSFAAADTKTRERNATFFVSMKEKIAELKPKPDFFLVDCRSGISEFEAFSLRLWADTMALFFNNNEETIKCLEQIVVHFQEIMVSSEKKLNIIPVMSRLPSGLLDEQTPSIQDKVSRRLFRESEKVPICTIHSDRNLEMREELRIAFEGITPNTRLSHEYVELCAYLINTPNYDRKDIEETVKNIQKAIGLAESEQEEDRVFNLKKKTGQMFNPHDGQPNVSFKIATFVQMLKELHERARRVVFEAGKSEEKSKKDAERMFYEGGIVCGENFATALLHTWNKKAKESKLSFNLSDSNTRIRNWCEFDSDVGFGRFNYVPATPATGEKNLIRLTNNFLSVGQTEDDPNLCLFMTGYIEGVLHRLLEDTSIRVTHLSEMCQRVHEERESCDFVIHTQV